LTAVHSRIGANFNNAVIIHYH